MTFAQDILSLCPYGNPGSFYVPMTLCSSISSLSRAVDKFIFYIEKYVLLSNERVWLSNVLCLPLPEAKKSAIVENKHESESITAKIGCFYLIWQFCNISGTRSVLWTLVCFVAAGSAMRVPESLWLWQHFLFILWSLSTRPHSLKIFQQESPYIFRNHEC